MASRHPREMATVGASVAAVALSALALTPSSNVGSAGLTGVCNPQRIYDFISRNREVISNASDKYGVPKLLIAATIMNENECRPRLEDWKDFIGKTLGMNVSLGVGQVRIDTARELYLKYNGKAISRSDAVNMLENPLENIMFIAMYYRNEIDHLGIPNTNVRNPEMFAELISRYTGGRHYRSRYAEISGVNGLMQAADNRLYKALGMRDRSYALRVRDYVSRNRNKIRKMIRM